MSFVHGSRSVFKLADGPEGTLQEISQALNESGVDQSIDVEETSVFGEDAKQYVVGLEDGTISLSGHFSTDSGHAYDVLKGIKREVVGFEYLPEGDTAGDPKLSGDCILTSFQVSSSVNGKVDVSASLQVTGGVTEGTV